MTITYDPRQPEYGDEGDLRQEMTRVFDLCAGCRLCQSLCPSFHTLLDLVDSHDGEAKAMTDGEQDRVVDECYQCKLCYLKCPYIPPHEWELDFPRLMLRAESAKAAKAGPKYKVTTEVLARTDVLGRVGVATAPVANPILQKPGSPVREVMDKVLGVAAGRVLPPYAKKRFSTWFRKRGMGRLGRTQQDKVAIFPTCMVEYHDTSVGRDLVKVYERNGVRCELVEGWRCCGAPWLHSGEHERFRAQAEHNVAALVRAVNRGADVVVPEPTCGYVLKKDYPLYLGTPEAERVSEHTFDASEFLWRMHKDPERTFDTEFNGDVPATTAYHAPCHLRAQNVGLRSRDLLKLTGTNVTVVAECSGIDGTWGLRAEHFELARKVAQPLKAGLDKAAADQVVGDCHLANIAIRQETERAALHPLQALARAYGIPPEAPPGEAKAERP